MADSWMIYGANGYTGKLIAEEAARRGLRPVVAGRSREPIEKLARELGLDHRVFSLEDPVAAASHVDGCKLVLNCAGPFSKTARPMIEACFEAQAHYLDITGEIDCLEEAASLAGRAAERGVALLPAVGFDVVPTDCLAASLAERLPSAQRLLLAFGGMRRLSPGTSKTILEGAPQGGKARINGQIRTVPVVWKSREIPFANGRKWAMTIPWGDVSTAYHSTGIANIEVYMAVPRGQIRWMRRLQGLRRLLALKMVRRAVEKMVERRVTGPSEQERRAGQAQLWGRVEADDGQAWEATMQTPEGYALTVIASLAAVERVLQSPPSPGFHTPSKAFGASFAASLPGVTMSEPRPCGES